MRTRLAYPATAALMLATACLAQVFTVGPVERHAAELSSHQKSLLLSAIQNASGDFRPDLLQSFAIFPQQLAENGPPAIIAISQKEGCGAAHPNCIFLVFRQEHGQEVAILNAIAGDYDLLNSRHMGSRDIVLKTYQGIHTMVSIWRYDGRQYRIHICTDETSEGAQIKVPPDHCG